MLKLVLSEKNMDATMPFLLSRKSNQADINSFSIYEQGKFRTQCLGI